MIINDIIENDIKELFSITQLDFRFLKNSSLLITGATGSIGSMLLRFLYYINHKLHLNLELILLVRNKDKLLKIFNNNKLREFNIIEQDIINYCNYNGKIDYIIHGASITDSCYMIEKPVETINTIVSGTKNILELAKEKKVKSLVFLSSMEVYGNILNKSTITENEYGVINILNKRSSYPAAKCLAECLMYCYFSEYGIPIKIARLSQVLSSSISDEDNRMPIQFARSIVDNKNIILHTKGESKRCYVYITDVINAIFTLLIYGKNGEAYNVTNKETFCSVLDIAQMLSMKFPNSHIQFEINDKKYPPTTTWNLNTTKLEQLNWKANVSLEEMFNRVIRSLKYIKYL